MGGAGSGSWYRFGKKTTTEECHSVDVRHLHRDGLLKPGSSFSLRWSRAGRETGSIRGVVDSSCPPKSMTLLYRHRSGLGGEWEDMSERVLLGGLRATSEERGPGFSAPERTAAGGLRFFTGRGATSCAATATTSAIGASARARRMDP
jgi:hypothetical protein